MNQEIQAYLRIFVTYSQTDWSELLPGVQLAINNRDSSLGSGPFFLNLGYHASAFSLRLTKNSIDRSKRTANTQLADQFVKKVT